MIQDFLDVNLTPCHLGFISLSLSSYTLYWKNAIAADLFYSYQVLSEDLLATIAKISFPKTMRWNSQVCWIFKWVSVGDMTLYQHDYKTFEDTQLLS